MKREFLTKELGLSKEMTDKIMAQYGESVNSLKSENEALVQENKSLKEACTEAEGLKENLNALNEQKAQLEESLGKLTKELEESKFNGALSSSLLKAGAKNLKAVGALIDKSKITFEEGKAQGLQEQIEAIKSECEYLFYEENQASGMRQAASGAVNDGFTSFARVGAKLN